MSRVSADKAVGVDSNPGGGARPGGGPKLLGDADVGLCGGDTTLPDGFVPGVSVAMSSRRATLDAFFFEERVDVLLTGLFFFPRFFADLGVRGLFFCSAFKESVSISWFLFGETEVSFRATG